MDREGVLKRHNELVELRRPEETAWRQLAVLLRPGDADFSSDTNRDNIAEEIFDSTPLYALENFVGGMFSQATSPTERWIELGSDDDDLNSYQPVKAWLYRRSNKIYATLGPSVSPYYSEVPAWFADLGTFGNGALYSEERVQQRRFLDKAVPLRECYIDTDSDGNTHTVHRERTLRVSQVRTLFRDAMTDQDERRQVKLLHCTYPNPEFRPGALGYRGKPFCSYYCSPDVVNFQQMGGYYEMPYHVIPWSKRSGKVYGYGPGHIVRADANMLQEMERSHITAAHFAAQPPTLFGGEDVIQQEDIYPNAFLYGTINEQGKALMQSFQRGGNLQLSMQQSEQRRQAILQGFYFGLMSIVNRPQMTASEFLGWQEERLRLMAPNLVRIQYYGLSTHIARRWSLLERAGAFADDPPPRELQDRKLEIRYVSPLAKAMKLSQGRATLQWVDGILKLGALAPEAVDNVDPDATAAILHDAFGPPPTALRSPDAIKRIRDMRAQAQAQQRQLETMGQGVSIAAEASHAAQASTLAGQRQR